MLQKAHYMRTPQAADYLGLSPATLIKDRWSSHLAIPYVKIGRTVLYDPSDLDVWVNQRKVNAINSDESIHGGGR